MSGADPPVDLWARNEARSGAVRSVVCKNFMCHANLHIELSPFVNFIVGRNGSGKSALFTAIAVCLGVTARKTGRAENLATFIMKGKDHASITIELHNGGKNPYRSDVFGRKIIVQRDFTEKSSTIKMKTESGREVPSTGRDLREMLSHFGLLLDNPFVLMGQDTVRSFLHGSSPEKLVGLFNEAVYLDDALKHNVETGNTLGRVDTHMESLRAEWRRREQVVLSAKAVLKQLLQVKTNRKKISDLTIEVVWLQLMQQEADVAAAEEFMQELEKEIAATRATAEGSEERMRAIQTERTELQRRTNELRQRIAQLSAQASSLAREKHDARRRLDAQEVALGTKERERVKALRAAEEAEAKIVELSAQINPDNDRALIMASIDEKRQALDAVRSERDPLDRVLEAARAAATHARAEHTANAERVRSQTEELRKCEAAIGRLRQATTNRLAALGPDVVSQARVRDQRRLTNVIGPVGALVRIEPGWEVAVEAAAKAHLSTFVVPSHDVRIEFQDACRRANVKVPSVAVIPDFNQAYVVPQLPRGVPALASRLAGTPAPMLNMLIDFARVEKVGTFETVADAKPIVFNPSSGVDSAFTKLGESVRLTGSSRAIFPFTGQRRIVVDAAADLDREMRRVEQLRAALAQEQPNAAQLARAVAEADARVVAAQKGVSRNDQQQGSLERDLARLSDRLGTVTDEDPRIAALASRAAEMREQARRREDEKRGLQEEIERLEGVMAALRQREQGAGEGEMAHELDELSDKERVLAAEFEGLRVARPTAATAIAKLEKQHAEAKQKRDELQRDSDQARDMLRQSNKEKPAAFSFPTPEACNAKIEKLKRDIEKIEAQVGMTFEQARAEYDRARSEASEAKQAINEREEEIKAIEAAHATHKSVTKAVMGTTRQAAKQMFARVLGSRHMEGDLVFVDEGERPVALKLLVRTSSDRTTSEVTDVRTLSGGERSFTVVALLSAVWEFIDSPVRGVDEVDVFMDHTARAEALRVLVEDAFKKDSQFMFLTPLDPSVIQVSELIKVHRMPDPASAAASSS